MGGSHTGHRQNLVHPVMPCRVPISKRSLQPLQSLRARVENSSPNWFETLPRIIQMLCTLAAIHLQLRFSPPNLGLSHVIGGIH